MVTASGEGHLDRKLEAVLARLCEKLGPLFKTQAVKLPYIVDVVGTRVLGGPITEGTHQAWEAGVVTREAWIYFTYPPQNTDFQLSDHEYSESGCKISYPDPDECVELLSDDEREVVNYVADEFGDYAPEKLGLLTKAMNPHISPDRWGSNEVPELGEEAYVHMSEAWFRAWARLPQLDLDDDSTWGTPIEDAQEAVHRAFNA